MKATVISAREAAKGLKRDRGQSVLIRTGDRVLLYGFGADGTAVGNMARLHIPSDAVDTAFLPSGLPEDTGGLPPFLKENRRAVVYARLNAFDPRWKKGVFGRKSIAPDDRLRSLRRILRCKNYFAEKDGSFVTFSLAAADEEPFPAEPAYFRRDGEGGIVADDFTHEMYLLVRSADKRWALFCGGAHAGLARIVGHAEELIERSLGGSLAWVVGGAYLPDGGDMSVCNRYIDEIVNALSGGQAVWYAGHDTGAYARTRLAVALGDRFRVYAAGDELEF